MTICSSTSAMRSIASSALRTRLVAFSRAAASFLSMRSVKPLTDPSLFCLSIMAMKAATFLYLVLRFLVVGGHAHELFEAVRAALELLEVVRGAPDGAQDAPEETQTLVALGVERERILEGVDRDVVLVREAGRLAQLEERGHGGRIELEDFLARDHGLLGVFLVDRVSLHAGDLGRDLRAVEHARRVEPEAFALDEAQLPPSVDVARGDLEMFVVELDRVVVVLLLRGLAGLLDHLGRRGGHREPPTRNAASFEWTRPGSPSHTRLLRSDGDRARSRVCKGDQPSTLANSSADCPDRRRGVVDARLAGSRARARVSQSVPLPTEGSSSRSDQCGRPSHARAQRAPRESHVRAEPDFLPGPPSPQGVDGGVRDHPCSPRARPGHVPGDVRGEGNRPRGSSGRLERPALHHERERRPRGRAGAREPRDRRARRHGSHGRGLPLAPRDPRQVLAPVEDQGAREDGARRSTRLAASDLGKIELQDSELEADGLVGRCIQHEMDHLDGHARSSTSSAPRRSNRSRLASASSRNDSPSSPARAKSSARATVERTGPDREASTCASCAGSRRRGIARCELPSRRRSASSTESTADTAACSTSSWPGPARTEARRWSSPSTVTRARS